MPIDLIRGGGGAERPAGLWSVHPVAVPRLQHPNVVQVYEVGESEGGPFLSLEYVGGRGTAPRRSTGSSSGAATRRSSTGYWPPTKGPFSSVRRGRPLGKRPRRPPGR